MKQRKKLRVIGSILCGIILLSSCVDEKYDFNNMDLTLQVGKDGSLTLPGSSIGDIRLSNLFDLADNGPISKVVKNGVEYYYLDKIGTTNPTPINIEDITIPRPEIEPFYVRLFGEKSLGVKANRVELVSWCNGFMRSAGPFDDASLEHMFYYDFKDSAVAVIPITMSAPINNDVLNISHISLDEYTSTVKFYVGLENYGRLKMVHYDNLAIVLPKGMEIADDIYYKDYHNGQPRATKGTKSIINGFPIVTFFAGEDLGSDTNHEAVIEAKIHGAIIGNDSAFSHFIFDPETHKVHLESRIQMLGYMRVDESDLDLTNLTQEEMTMVAVAGKEALIPTDIYYKGGGEFDSKLYVNSFSGRLEHRLTNINDIQLTNLPTFLEGNDVTLDLQNPELILIVNSDINTLATTRIKVNAYQGEMLSAKGLDTGDVILDGRSGKTLVKILANDPSADAIVVPSEYFDGNHEIENIQVRGIGNLIRRIPDRIEIVGADNDHSILVSLPDCQDLNLRKDYRVGLDYRIYCPLTFGDDFQIVYRDTQRDWNLGTTLDGMDFGSLQIDATVNSTLPLALSMEASFLGKDGSDIGGTCIIEYLYQDMTGSYQPFNPKKLYVRPHADGKRNEDHIRIIVHNKDVNKGLKEILDSSAGGKQLDGISYVATMNEPASNTEALQTQAGVVLKDVHITLHGGFTYDAN